MIKFLGKLKLQHKRKNFKKEHPLKNGYHITAKDRIHRSGKGGDIWGKDWIVPVAQEYEWDLFYNTDSGKQYIRTYLTDYIFWFIPFHYDEYIYEVPDGRFNPETITDKEVINLIYDLEHWNWHTDIYPEDWWDYVYINGTEYKIGNNDYQFMRTREE